MPPSFRLISFKTSELLLALACWAMYFLMNLRSKVSLCTDALHWDSSGVGVQVQNNELFSEIINHRILKLGMMLLCDEGFSKMHSLIPLAKVKGH